MLALRTLRGADLPELGLDPRDLTLGVGRRGVVGRVHPRGRQRVHLTRRYAAALDRRLSRREALHTGNRHDSAAEQARGDIHVLALAGHGQISRSVTRQHLVRTCCRVDHGQRTVGRLACAAPLLAGRAALGQHESGHLVALRRPQRTGRDPAVDRRTSQRDGAGGRHRHGGGAQEPGHRRGLAGAVAARGMVGCARRRHVLAGRRLAGGLAVGAVRLRAGGGRPRRRRGDPSRPHRRRAGRRGRPGRGSRP